MFYIKIYKQYNDQNLESIHLHIFYIDHFNCNIDTSFHIFNKWNINFQFKLNKTSLLLLDNQNNHLEVVNFHHYIHDILNFYHLYYFVTLLIKLLPHFNFIHLHYLNSIHLYYLNFIHFNYFDFIDLHFLNYSINHHFLNYFINLHFLNYFIHHHHPNYSINLRLHYFILL